MKQVNKYLRLSLLFSMGLGLIHADSNDNASFPANDVKTMFVPISQGSNLYTQYHKPIYTDECECWNMDFSVTYRYQRTHDAEDIAAHLFQNNPLKFQGSDVSNRSSSALVADYFGLAPDTDATLRLDPRIQNNIIDLQLALGLDGLCEGLWFQVNVPVVSSDWDLGSNNSIGQESGDRGSSALDAGLEATIGSTAQPIVSGGSAGTPLLTAVNDATTTDASKNLVQIDGNSATDGYMFEGGFKLDAAGTVATQAFVRSAGLMSPLSIKATAQTNVPNPDSQPAPTDATAVSGALASTEVSAGQFGKKAGAGTVTITRDEVAAADSISAALQGDFTFGDFQQRKYNIIGGGTSVDGYNKDDDTWRVADIHLQLGYDFWKEDCYHLAFYLKSVIPTGTKLDQEHAAFAFSPIVGNGRHFELGAGFNAHAELWCCDDSSFNAYIDGYLTHMFDKTQFRTFDLNGKPMSRYALVKSLNDAGNSNNTSTTASEDKDSQEYAYAGELHAAGDLLAGEVEVYSAVRGEFVLDLVYTCCNWEVGGGYAFSGQTKEKVDEGSFNAGSDSGVYGLKGGTYLSDIKLAASTEAPASTIVGGVMYRANGEVASSATAYSLGDAEDASSDNLLDIAEEQNLISKRTNRSGLMNGQALHRIFGHIDYTWSDSCWLPMLGIVGSVGFTGSSHLSAQYWDIGARFGFNY